MLAVLVQIPVGDLRVLAASAACIKLIVAYLPQNIVSLINKKLSQGIKSLVTVLFVRLICILSSFHCNSSFFTGQQYCKRNL